MDILGNFDITTLFERLYHGTKKYMDRFLLLSLIRRVRKSISERQTLIKNINQNIFSFLKFFIFENFQNFSEKSCDRTSQNDNFSQNPVLLRLWTDGLCVQKSIRAKLACSQSFYRLVEAFQSDKHLMKNMETHIAGGWTRSAWEFSQYPRFSGIRTLSKAHNLYISSKSSIGRTLDGCFVFPELVPDQTDVFPIVF